jgi:dipeptide/tripeptide permease
MDIPSESNVRKALWKLFPHVSPNSVDNSTTRVLILMLIPLFDRQIYPSFGKCNLLTKPLHRILCGGIRAGISFLIAALVEMEIIRQSEASIKFHMMWQLPQYLLMTYDGLMFTDMMGVAWIVQSYHYYMAKHNNETDHRIIQN